MSEDKAPAPASGRMSADKWLTLHSGYGPDQKTIFLPVRCVEAIVESYRSDRGWETRVTSSGYTFVVTERGDAILKLIAGGEEGK